MDSIFTVPLPVSALLAATSSKEFQETVADFKSELNCKTILQFLIHLCSYSNFIQDVNVPYGSRPPIASMIGSNPTLSKADFECLFSNYCGKDLTPKESSDIYLIFMALVYFLRVKNSVVLQTNRMRSQIALTLKNSQKGIKNYDVTLDPEYTNAVDKDYVKEFEAQKAEVYESFTAALAGYQSSDVGPMDKETAERCLSKIYDYLKGFALVRFQTPWGNQHTGDYAALSPLSHEQMSPDAVLQLLAQMSNRSAQHEGFWHKGKNYRNLSPFDLARLIFGLPLFDQLPPSFLACLSKKIFLTERPFIFTFPAMDKLRCWVIKDTEVSLLRVLYRLPADADNEVSGEADNKASAEADDEISAEASTPDAAKESVDADEVTDEETPNDDGCEAQESGDKKLVEIGLPIITTVKPDGAEEEPSSDTEEKRSPDAEPSRPEDAKPDSKHKAHKAARLHIAREIAAATDELAVTIQARMSYVELPKFFKQLNCGDLSTRFQEDEEFQDEWIDLVYQCPLLIQYLQGTSSQDDWD